MYLAHSVSPVPSRDVVVVPLWGLNHVRVWSQEAECVSQAGRLHVCFVKRGCRS